MTNPTHNELANLKEELEVLEEYILNLSEAQEDDVFIVEEEVKKLAL